MCTMLGIEGHRVQDTLRTQAHEMRIERLWRRALCERRAVDNDFFRVARHAVRRVCLRAGVLVAEREDVRDIVTGRGPAGGRPYPRGAIDVYRRGPDAD